MKEGKPKPEKTATKSNKQPIKCLDLINSKLESCQREYLISNVKIIIM